MLATPQPLTQRMEGYAAGDQGPRYAFSSRAFKAVHILVARLASIESQVADLKLANQQLEGKLKSPPPGRGRVQWWKAGRLERVLEQRRLQLELERMQEEGLQVLEERRLLSLQQGERRLENLKKRHSWKALVACAKYELQIAHGRKGRRDTH